MIIIIDCGSSWVRNIKENIKTLNHEVTILKLDKIIDSDFELCSGIIISGRPTLLTQENIQKHLDKLNFIKDVSIPILGICFGHQIIGLLYKAEIKIGESIDKKEIIEITENNNLFKNILNNSLFQEAHSEFISLPKNFVLLAKSESCNNEAMKHKNKKIYCTQFHPEVSENNGKILIGNFLEICK